MSPWVLAYGLLAAVLSIVGGLVPPPRTRPRPFLLGVAAGFLLGLAIVGLIPEALHEWHGDPHVVLAIVVLGYLAVGATHQHHTPVPVAPCPDETPEGKVLWNTRRYAGLTGGRRARYRRPVLAPLWRRSGAALAPLWRRSGRLECV